MATQPRAATGWVAGEVAGAGAAGAAGPVVGAGGTEPGTHSGISSFRSLVNSSPHLSPPVLTLLVMNRSRTVRLQPSSIFAASALPGVFATLTLLRTHLKVASQ